MKQLTITVCFLLASASAFCQTQDSYKFTMGVLHTKTSPESGIDSATMDYVVRTFKEMIGDEIYFTGHKLVFIDRDSESGDVIKRNLADLDSGALYVIDEKSKSYTKDMVDEKKEETQEGRKEIARYPLPRKVFGFQVDSILIKNAGVPDTSSILVTSDFDAAPLRFLETFVWGENELIIRTNMRFMGAEVSYGLTSFEQIDKIDEGLLSVELVDYSDETWKKDIFANILEEDSKQTTDEPYQGKGVNLDIIRQWEADSLFNPNVRYYFEKRQEWYDDNISLDRYSLLEVMRNEFDNKKYKTPVDYVQLLGTYEVLSESELGLLKQMMKENPDMSMPVFWSCAQTIVVKNDLENPENRMHIVANQVKLGYDSGRDTVARKQYLAGEIDLSQYLIKVNELFIPLEEMVVTKDEDIANVVSEFLIKCFGENMHFDVSNDTDHIMIKTADYSYAIDKSNIKSLDWNSYNEETGRYAYKDTIMINGGFYDNLLPTIKQINADYKLPYAFGIYDFTDLVYISYDAENILQGFPALRSAKVNFCLNRFIAEDYDVAIYNPIALPHYYYTLDQGFSIPSYLLGDADGLTPWVTSAKKRGFVNFLKQYGDEFNVTSESIESIENEIYNRLLSSELDLIKYFSDVAIRISPLNDPFGYGDYNPQLSDGRNSLQDIFPALHRLIGKDMALEQFSYSKTPQPTVEFTYDGNRYQTGASQSAVLEKIIEIIRSDDSLDKDLYMIYGGVDDTYYLWLSKEQFDRLKTLTSLIMKKM